MNRKKCIYELLADKVKKKNRSEVIQMNPYIVIKPNYVMHLLNKF